VRHVPLAEAHQSALEGLWHSFRECPCLILF
jgi:hypothetical protein